VKEKALSCAGLRDLRLTFSPAWLRNFVVACGFARSTAAYDGSFGGLSRVQCAALRRLRSLNTFWLHNVLYANASVGSMSNLSIELFRTSILPVAPQESGVSIG